MAAKEASARTAYKPTRPAPVTTRDHARQWLKMLLADGGAIEVRITETPTDYGRPYVTAGWFDEMETAVDAVMEANKLNPPAIYATFNPVDDSLLGRSNNQLKAKQNKTSRDENIVRRRWLFLDIDPTRPAGIIADGNQRLCAQQLADQVLAFLELRDFPEPVRVDSGNGQYLLYRIDEPNDDATASLIKGVLAALASRFPESDYGAGVDTSVFNAARIARIPGTMNRKGDEVPKQGREYRECRITYIPGELGTVTRAQLEALASGNPKESSGQNDHLKGEEYSGTNHVLNVPRWLTDRGVEWEERKPGEWSVECPWQGSEHDNANAGVTQDEHGKMGFHCFGRRCEGNGWAKFRDRIGEPDWHHYDPPKPEPERKAEVKVKDDLPPPPERMTDRVDFETFSMREFAAMDLQVRWLVERILVANEPMLLCAPKKTMKTSFLVDMAVSLATQTPFLDCFEVQERAKVCFFAAEGSRISLRRSFYAVAEQKGFNLPDIEGLHVAFEPPKFYRLEHLAAVARTLDQTGAEVLLIDPAYFCIDGSEAGNLFKQAEQLRPIVELCEERNVTLALAHHMGKSLKAGEEPMLEHISWAGFQEFAAQWLLMNRRQRYEPGTGRHVLIVSAGGRISGGGLHAVDIDEGTYPDKTWAVTVGDGYEAMKTMRSDARQEKERNAKAKEAAKVEEAKKEIRRHFRRGEKSEEWQPFTKRDRREACGRSKAYETATLEMLETGELLKMTVKRGRSQQECEAYQFYVGYPNSNENNDSGHSGHSGPVHCQGAV